MESVKTGVEAAMVGKTTGSVRLPICAWVYVLGALVLSRLPLCSLVSDMSNPGGGLRRLGACILHV